jgi:hypothetical protein
MGANENSSLKDELSLCPNFDSGYSHTREWPKTRQSTSLQILETNLGTKSGSTKQEGNNLGETAWQGRTVRLDTADCSQVGRGPSEIASRANRTFTRKLTGTDRLFTTREPSVSPRTVQLSLVDRPTNYFQTKTKSLMDRTTRLKKSQRTRDEQRGCRHCSNHPRSQLQLPIDGSPKPLDGLSPNFVDEKCL